MTNVGFIGLGNVGAKLAGSLLRNGVDLTVRDLDVEAAKPLLDRGARWADTPREVAEQNDVVVTVNDITIEATTSGFTLGSPDVLADDVTFRDLTVDGVRIESGAGTVFEDCTLDDGTTAAAAAASTVRLSTSLGWFNGRVKAASPTASPNVVVNSS